MLPWRTSEIEVLLEQMDATQGVPEVPGGYTVTSRERRIRDSYGVQ